MAHQKLVFWGTPEDKNYLPMLKPMVGLAEVFVKLDEVLVLSQVTSYCKQRGITGVISNRKDLLLKLLAAYGNPKNSCSLDNYTGSYFTYDGLEFVFVNPLEHLVRVSYGSFLTRRYISKLVYPESWTEQPEFNWELLTPTNYEQIFNQFKSATFITVDIETVQEDLRITCIGYTAVWVNTDSNTVNMYTVVLPIEDMFAVSIMRKFNSELKAPKALQNGKYDCLYLARYSAPLYNYLYDTANMMHCWYSELPKDLSFLNSFFVRRAMYWKDLAQTTDKMEYYKYNALDNHATAMVVISWLLQAPQWAKANYLQEFPLTFPCHMSELIGLKRDMAALEVAKAHYDTVIEKDNILLSKMVGTYPAIYNVNSAPQNAALRKILGCGDIPSSDEVHLKKIGNRHPLNKRIVNKILDLRGTRKLVSTYLTTGEKAKELKGRILYSLNPHNTDTARLASKESAFWCGLNIQNVPRGKEVKQTIVADNDFVLVECDSAQAESRDTAYASGDSNYIDAVSGEDDFHSRNASAFFGVPYAEIYDNTAGKTLNKPLRQLAKPVNHGANYLMGWSVLIDSMGEDMVWEAKRLLQLPRHWGLREVSEYLLSVFHKTYPTLSSTYYPAVVAEVMKTKMLVSHDKMYKPKVYDIEPIFPTQEEYDAMPLTGWTRYCFGNPRDNKLDKNGYVAHVSQNKNAMRLNIAYLRVFYEIAINPKYAKHFKLCAQIHDSILFQHRIGHEYLQGMVRERMEVPVTICGADNIIRTYVVPADIKSGKDNMGAYRWSETE